MLIILKFIFHFICSIGRFIRKIFQLIFGRRHEEPGISISKTEPVTLEHIRIISDMENDSNRPYQSFTSVPKVIQIRILFNYIIFLLVTSSRMEFLGYRRYIPTETTRKSFSDSRRKC